MRRRDRQDGMERKDSGKDADPRATFEEFTAGAAWRALPLKIKLKVMSLWRSERDVPTQPPADKN
jgi:hypothetical protein